MERRHGGLLGVHARHRLSGELCGLASKVASAQLWRKHAAGGFANAPPLARSNSIAPTIPCLAASSGVAPCPSAAK